MNQEEGNEESKENFKCDKNGRLNSKRPLEEHVRSSNGSSNNSNNAYLMHKSVKQENGFKREGNSSHLNFDVSPETERAEAAAEDMKNNVDYLSVIEKCPAKVACNSFATNKFNNIGESVGSTSQGTCSFLRPNINEGAGPSNVEQQQVRPRENLERRDSSSGNEGDFSDGEEYCIYTYKGNDNDDPSPEDLRQRHQLERLQMEHPNANNDNPSGRSSPEMDFLEMDFDPGPSCEQDTLDSDLASINDEIQNIAMDNIDKDSVLLNDLSGGKVVLKQNAESSAPENADTCKNVVEEVQVEAVASTSAQAQAQSANPKNPSSNQDVDEPPWFTDFKARTKTIGSYRNLPPPKTLRSSEWNYGCPLQDPHDYHKSGGDLISPGEGEWSDPSEPSTSDNFCLDSRKINFASGLYHSFMEKKLLTSKLAPFNQSGDSESDEVSNERLAGPMFVDRAMIWKEQEATDKQVTQIGKSACGATSCINALTALNVSYSMEVLIKSIATRQREIGASLPRYLMSRSMAGATHEDLARGISLATSGAVVTKFFEFYPERKVLLSHWLHYWITRGAVPIATLNLQHCGEGCDIPDAWHHQMIFGVGQEGIYLTNPLECLRESIVYHQLVSPSVLLVKRADVLAHWNSSTDLRPLALYGKRWRQLNVLGQVVNMVREKMGKRHTTGETGSPPTNLANYVRIPASYTAGITLVMNADAEAAMELMNTEKLPVL